MTWMQDDELDIMDDVSVIMKEVLQLETDGLDLQTDEFQWIKNSNNDFFSLNCCKSV